MWIEFQSQPDFEGFLRALQFPPSSKIDSQYNPSSSGAVLRSHIDRVQGRATSGAAQLLRSDLVDLRPLRTARKDD